jgi:hypothetical protein
MAFGLLGSVIPNPSKNTVLYISATDLIDGKVAISHKNFEDVKVRVAITTGADNLNYIHYNRVIPAGQTLQTNDLFFGNGQKLVVHSSHANTQFLLYGEVIDDTNDSGILRSVTTEKNKRVLLYEAPADTSTVVNINAYNFQSFASKARLGITSGPVADFESSEYIEYNVKIEPTDSYERRGIKLSNGQKLVCSSDDGSRIGFTVYGKTDEAAAGAAVGDGNFVNLTAQGNFSVVGGGASITGIVTAASFDGSIDAGQLSGRINSAVTGEKLVFGGNSAVLGVANTVFFNNNLTTNVSDNVVTVALSDSINVAQNASVTGTLSVGSTVNVLNNKVTNVATATSNTDATNKRYVDTRSVAMSIALS